MCGDPTHKSISVIYMLYMLYIYVIYVIYICYIYIYVIYIYVIYIYVYIYIYIHESIGDVNGYHLSSPDGGFHSHGGTPIARCYAFMETRNLKWMRTLGVAL